MEKKPTKILVTGACGQIGTELVEALRKKHGTTAVIASDILDRSRVSVANYRALNVLNKDALDWLIRQEEVTEIYHLAAILSASGEERPLAGWDLNMTGLLNVLEGARTHGIEKIFWPS